MPKQKRWDLKRSCEFMETNLARALKQSNKLYNVYYPNYPDYYPIIECWCIAIHQLQLSVVKFKGEI